MLNLIFDFLILYEHRLKNIQHAHDEDQDWNLHEKREFYPITQRHWKAGIKKKKEKTTKTTSGVTDKQLTNHCRQAIQSVEILTIHHSNHFQEIHLLVLLFFSVGL